jgi:hypothetical protein
MATERTDNGLILQQCGRGGLLRQGSLFLEIFARSAEQKIQCRGSSHWKRLNNMESTFALLNLRVHIRQGTYSGVLPRGFGKSKSAGRL